MVNTKKRPERWVKIENRFCNTTTGELVCEPGYALISLQEERHAFFNHKQGTPVMDFNMYSIYDQAADAYLPPFILPREAMAVRTFAQCVNSPDHQFSQAPADYTLFQIASFDDAVGLPVPDVAPKKIANGVELLGLMDEGAKDGPSTDTHEGQNGQGKPLEHGAQRHDSPE